ncbi:MAG: PilZ domain-containing protein [Myxococcales bacterium]|nr:PilZ domain-containing protein [Myxococcales bacterium]
MGPLSEITKLPLITPRPKVPADRRLGERRQQKSLAKALIGSRPILERERRKRSERRATPRVEVQLECEERVGPARYFRLTSDLSTFGIGVRRGCPRKVGTRLKLLIHLPDEMDCPVEVEAEVVSPYDVHGGMRLAFRNPSREAARRIHRYLVFRMKARAI